jgi:hypothetical protein
LRNNPKALQNFVRVSPVVSRFHAGSLDVMAMLLHQVTNLLEKKNKPNLEDLAILREFIDVFVDEISELPPRREIDFCIDLLSGSAPISKAPYQMSFQELTKIKI